MAATQVKVIDYSVYPPREETVTLSGMPRVNEIFVWSDSDVQQHTIQNVIWQGDDGSLIIQVN